jgi:hypothetical protein
MSNLTIPGTGDSNDGMIVETLRGGIQRVSVAAPKGTETTGDPLRGGVSDGSALRMHADGRVEQFGGVTRSTTADLVNRTSDTIMETVRRPSGAPVTREVQPTDRVTVNGMEMDVRTAVTLKYLRFQGGEYVETGAHRADREQPAGSLTDGDAESPSEQQAPEPIAALHTAAQEHGLDVDQLAGRVIAAGNLEAVERPEAMQPHAQAALAHYQQAADAAVSALGVEPADLWTWAQEHHAAELRDAVVAHYTTRDPAVYATLAQRYLLSVAPDAATMKAGGLDTTTRDGQDMVTIGGLTLTAKAAARAGLI